MQTLTLRAVSLPALALFLLAFAQPPATGGATPTQQLFLLKELKPELQRVGVIWRAGTSDDLMKQVQRAAAGAGLQAVVAPVEDVKDVAPAFRNMRREHQIDALWIVENDGLVDSDLVRKFLIKSTIESGMPLLAPTSDWVEQGASITLTADGDGIGLIVNEAAAAALALDVPAKYRTRTQFLAAN